MGASASQLFDNVPKSDPLNFGLNEDDGLDYKEITNFAGFDKNELSKLAGISKQSVRTDKNIPNALRERLQEIAIICTLVAEYFDGDAKKTAIWFNTPNPSLGDISPKKMVRLGRSNKLIKFIAEARRSHEEEGGAGELQG